MSETINIYCDESCHLHKDKSDVMVLGAITCPDNVKKTIFQEIRTIKIKHNLSRDFEIKWTKVSNSKIDFYIDIIQYFLNNDFLTFRAIIIPNKEEIKTKNKAEWDEFYHKMYYQLLINLLNPKIEHNIYLDIQNTNGAKRRNKLLEILQNMKSDNFFAKDVVVKKVQAVHSHEVELIQLADLLLGAVCYANRNIEKTNEGKLKLISELKMQTGYSLTKTTFLSEQKFNLFKIRLNKEWGI